MSKTPAFLNSLIRIALCWALALQLTLQLALASMAGPASAAAPGAGAPYPIATLCRTDVANAGQEDEGSPHGGGTPCPVCMACHALATPPDNPEYDFLIPAPAVPAAGRPSPILVSWQLRALRIRGPPYAL